MASLQNRRRAILIAGIICVVGALAGFAGLRYLAPANSAGKPEIYTGLVDGVGAGGYDVVAYFTDNKAEKGDPAITATWKGATWRFVSAANRDLFNADPDRYTPQFGGYCAYAVAQGGTAKGDPEQWTVVNDKLYLNYDAGVKQRWEKDRANYITKAEENWPKVIEK